MINRNFLRGFYGLVLLIALAGQALAARDWLGWPLLAAVAAVAGVEFGGVVLSVHADERRRLGERALGARFLAAAVAAGAVALNWLGHGDHLVGGFFAGMSGLGFSIWLLDSAAKRRDALRAIGKLPPTPPAYGWVQWARHPWLTRRARSLALAAPSLGLYGSLDAAGAEVRAERRQGAIAAELRKMIAAAAGPTMATVAVNTFDLDEIAVRLADAADYDGLAARLAAQLTPAALAPADGSRSLPREESPRADLDEVSGAGQVSHPGHVELSTAGQLPGRTELSHMNQSHRGEDSPRELSHLGQSAGVASATREQESITGPTGHEINDGDLFELAATLTDRPHYPLPRTAAEQVRTGTVVPVATGGQPDSLSLAALMPAPTVAVTATFDRSHGDLTNGRHNGAVVTAIPPAVLTATETPETPPADAHPDRQNDGHDGEEMTATPEVETAPDDGHDERHDGDPAATVAVKTAAKKATRAKVSDNERKVLRALSKTPKATAAEIGRQTRIPESTVRRILAKLREQDTAGVAS